MADLIRRSLTDDEAIQAIRCAVSTWRRHDISPAEALARIGDAIEAGSRQAGKRELRPRSAAEISTSRSRLIALESPRQ